MGQVVLCPEQGPHPGPLHRSQGQGRALSPEIWEQKQRMATVSRSDVFFDKSFMSIRKVP